MTRALLVAAAALLFAAQGVHALDVPERHGYVTDLASLLSAEEANALADKLAGYERSTGHQFAFLSVPTLAGASIEELGVAVAHAWKLGDAARDDGLLLLVARQERKVRVEVGYGLEAAIPDVTAANVILSIAAPAFKRGAWAEGASATFDELARAAAAAASDNTADNAPTGDSKDTSIVVVAPPSGSEIQNLADPDSMMLWVFLLAGVGVYAFVWWLLRRDRQAAAAYQRLDYQPPQQKQPQPREFDGRAKGMGVADATAAMTRAGALRTAARTGLIGSQGYRLPSQARAVPATPPPQPSPRDDGGSTLTNVLLTGLLVEELTSHTSSSPPASKPASSPQPDECDRDTWPGSSPSLFGSADRDSSPGFSWGGGGDRDSDDGGRSGGGGDFGGGGASGDF